MKFHYSKALKLFSMSLLLVLFLAPQQADAQRKKKKKKGKTEMPAKPAPAKKKGKTIKDLTKSSKEIDGLFKIYQDTITGTLQMLIKEDQIGPDFIHFNQLADGVVDAGSFRGAYRGSKVFKIKKYFSFISLF